MMKEKNAIPVKNRHLVMITLIWVLLVLYPNPLHLFRSIHRSWLPPVNPDGVLHLLNEAPTEAEPLERYVLQQFPYQYDWITYGMPWYFPTLEEALEKQAGDCKTRFIVLASLFEAQKIPYRQSFSLSHFWVIYDGKEENAWEREQNAFLLREEDGSARLQIPQEDRSQIYRNFRDGFWRAMPTHRKRLLLAGPLTAFLAGILLHGLRKKEKTTVGPAPIDA